MGKRHNKKKKLLNSDSGKKPSTLHEQKCCSEKKAEVLLPKKNQGNMNTKYENVITEAKNFHVSNKQISQKSNLMKCTTSRHAYDITESKIVYNYEDINSTTQDATISNMRGVRPKQGKKIISGPNVNESEYYLCEDLFSSGHNKCADSDSDFLNSKDISFFGTKEKLIERKGGRIKNNPKVISEKIEYNIHKKSENERNMLNKQGFQNLDIIKFTGSVSKATDSFEHKSRIKIQDNIVSNLYGARPKSNKVISDPCIKEFENYLFGDYNDNFESDNEYKGRKKSEQKQELNSKEIASKESFLSSVTEYKHTKNAFLSIYHKWLPVRKITLEKLRSLYEEVKNGRIQYNEAQAELKEFSTKTRSAKVCSDNALVSFFASAMTLVADAASGASSFAQAYNTDCFQSKFQEILNHDAEITRDLYEVRSRCVAEYRDIEEVMRKFHADTFSSTVSKVSDALEVGKYWEAMKKAYGNDDMTKLMNIVGDFFNNACQSEVLGKVCDSVETYVNDNPAALEGCKSTGKALYESTNTWSPVYPRNSLRGTFDVAISNYLILKDQEEALQLKNSSEHYSQSKLESQIEDAIDSLESEMREIAIILKEKL